MKQMILVALIILVLSGSYSYAHMEGGMMGSGVTAPGYGGHMMGDTTQQKTPATAPGYGGHMMGSGMMGGMMGSGMMGYGSGYGIMSPCMMDSGMMGSGYGGHMIGQGMMQGMMGTGYGGPMMGSNMMSIGMMGYGSEEEQRKFLSDTIEPRRELHNKMFELREALRSPDTTLDTLLELKKEILEIKVRIYEKALKK